MQEVKDHLYMPSPRLNPMLEYSYQNVSLSNGWFQGPNFQKIISDFFLDLFLTQWPWIKIILFYIIGLTSLFVILIVSLKLGFKVLIRIIFVSF